MPEPRAVGGGEEDAMRAFTIDTDDNITAFVSTEELGDLKEGTHKVLQMRRIWRVWRQVGRVAGWWRSGTAWRAFGLSKSLLAARRPSPGFGRPFSASGKLMSSSRPPLASPRRRRYRQARPDADP